jgi:hypothetical protein
VIFCEWEALREAAIWLYFFFTLDGLGWIGGAMDGGGMAA